MPWAKAPNAPWVEVWLSPQTIVVPGGEALLGAYDMDNALALVELMEIFHAEIFCVLGERLNLNAAFFLGNAMASVGGGHIVVNHGKSAFRMAHLAARLAQALEGLGGSHFMDQVPIDIEQAGAIVGFVNQMVVPDLVVKCAWLCHVKSQNSVTGRYLALATHMSNPVPAKGLAWIAGGSFRFTMSMSAGHSFARGGNGNAVSGCW